MEQPVAERNWEKCPVREVSSSRHLIVCSHEEVKQVTNFSSWRGFPLLRCRATAVFLIPGSRKLIKSLHRIYLSDPPSTEQSDISGSHCFYNNVPVHCYVPGNPLYVLCNICQIFLCHRRTFVSHQNAVFFYSTPWK